MLAARSALGRPGRRSRCSSSVTAAPTARRARSKSSRTLGSVPLVLPKLPGYAYGHRNVALEQARGNGDPVAGGRRPAPPGASRTAGALWDTGRYDLVTAPSAVVHPDDRLVWCGENWGVERDRVAVERKNSNVMASVSVSVASARDAGGWDASLPRWGDWDLWKRSSPRAAAPGRSATRPCSTSAPRTASSHGRTASGRTPRGRSGWTTRQSSPGSGARSGRSGTTATPESSDCSPTVSASSPGSVRHGGGDYGYGSPVCGAEPRGPNASDLCG